MANIIRKEEINKAGLIKEYIISDIAAVLQAGQGMGFDDGVFDVSQADSESSVENKIEKAINKGYEDGFNQGLIQAKESLQSAINLLNTMAKELKDFKDTALSQAEEELLKISLAIAKKIILEEPKHNLDVIKNVVKEAIKQLIDKEELAVKVNSADMQSLKEVENQIFSSVGVSGKVKLVVDDFVTRGSCIIESRSGSVDADFKTQIAEIENNLVNNNDGTNKSAEIQ